jgi:hypothetical protein
MEVADALSFSLALIFQSVAAPVLACPPRLDVVGSS